MSISRAEQEVFRQLYFKTQYPAACCAWVRRRRFTMGGQKSLSRRADESFLLLLLLVNWRQPSPRATPFRLPPAIPFRGDYTGRFLDLTRSASFTSTIACFPLVSSISMERLRLHRPGLPPGRPRHPSSGCSPQVHIARLAAFAPGGHPVGVGLRALAALFDLFHLPHGQVFQPGLELEGLGLCQGLLRLALQPLRFLAGCGCAGGFLQGSGITGQLPGGR